MSVAATPRSTGALRRMGRPVMRRVRKLRRRGALREAVATIRRARGARLVLVYHRIAPRDAPRDEIVPTVPADLFREQLTTFAELGRFVPLDSLIADPGDREGPLRFALTFDDDYDTHARYVLPVLRDLGLPATFFLSGRSLHGLGGYWFQRLEALVDERGVAATAALLDVPDVDHEVHLARACEGDPSRQGLIDRYAPAGDPPLDAAGIRLLAEAGMTIGFHTLRHPVLPLLDDAEATTALTVGKDRLAALVEQPLRWFAYPHGKTDERITTLTRQAGYTAALTTQLRLLHAADDHHQLGRWEPSPMPTHEVVIRLGHVLQHAMA